MTTPGVLSHTYNPRAIADVRLNGTVTGATCNTDGTAGGSYDTGTTTVSGTLNNLPAGSTSTLRFRTTIN